MDFLAQMYRLAKQRAQRLGTVKEDDFPIRPLAPVLRDMAVIAEVKYATPAEGHLGIKEKPEDLARRYADLGAQAISCLTEPRYFAGDLAFLPRIRRVNALPVLMKDFIVDARQIAAGLAQGADAVLLIAEMLSLTELRDLHRVGKELGLDILVEAHGLSGLEKALAVGAQIIGVNARDLSTLTVNPRRHEEMIAQIPAGVVKVAESGIKSGARLEELKTLGYDAALIGRALADKALRTEIFPCG